jgi:hypothetical protein
MASTKDVLDHHLKCFGEGDLEGILSDYAQGALAVTVFYRRHLRKSIRDTTRRTSQS